MSQSKDALQVDLKTFFNDIKNVTIMGIDTETIGDVSDPHSRKLVMLQLATKNYQYIFDARTQDVRPVLQAIKKLGIELCGHNLKYDYAVLKVNCGIELETLYDTQLASQLVEYDVSPNTKGYFTLESCVRRHIDSFAYSNQMNLFQPEISKKLATSFNEFLPFTEPQLFYGAYDALYSLILAEKLRKLAQEASLSNAIAEENQFLKVLADMEINGIPADAELFLQASRNARVQTLHLSSLLHDISPINWDSPKQVNTYLKSIGVDTQILDKKTGELKESVGKAVLSSQLLKFPILNQYVDYKIEDKKCKAYGEKFLRFWNTSTGRIHTSFLQLMNTGRTSSSAPNMQNIPRGKDYRKAFRTDADHVFVSADFSNQEMRVLAFLSQDKNLLDAVSKTDVHLETAKIMYNNPDLDASSKERVHAKSVNFLISYGGGAKKLSENFGISMAEAKNMLQHYRAAFPSLETYFKEQGELARKNGYIVVNQTTGRRVGLPKFERYKLILEHINYYKNRGWEIRPDLLDEFSYLYSKYQRLAQNYRVQGLSADISKKAGIYLRKYSTKLQFKIVLLVHDEWVLECPKELSSTVKYILEMCCKKAVADFMNIPIPAEAGIETFWTK